MLRWKMSAAFNLRVKLKDGLSSVLMISQAKHSEQTKFCSNFLFQDRVFCCRFFSETDLVNTENYVTSPKIDNHYGTNAKMHTFLLKIRIQ